MRRAYGAALAAIAAAWVIAVASTPAAAEQATLEDSSWALASLAGGAPIALPGPTARFASGRVQGSDGCNRYSVPFTATGPSALSVGRNAAVTRMACPAELARQASAFIDALTGAASYRLEAGELQLLAADGAVLASFVAQSQSLAGTTWRAVGINNGNGAVASVVAASSVTITFGADGSVSGDAGCNRYRSTYQSDGTSLRLAPAAATRRLCVAPEVMTQEQAFLRALESVATMRLEGDRLELRTATGALALSLQREPGP